MSIETIEATAGEKPPDNNRRKFLSTLSMVMGVAAAAAVALPVIGFMLTPLLRLTPSRWRTVISAASVKIGETVAVSFVDSSPLPWSGVTARTAAWLQRKSEGEFIAFSVNCTHLGCPVRWLPDAELFMCRCHGGVYYSDGTVASGPPPHALFRYQTRVQDGAVQILTTGIPTVEPSAGS
jgi:menaquinol-cytochrome c reductase iron-sulfur subunit